MGWSGQSRLIALVLVVAVFVLVPSVAQAVGTAWDVTIVPGSGDPSNVTYGDGLFTAIGADATIPVETLEGVLADQPITINTGNGGNQPGGITISTSITSTATNSLTLEPSAGILINGQVQLAGDLILDGGGQSNDSITGTGGLEMTGPNTFILDASDTYGGATAINGGTLQTEAADAIPATSAVTIANTAGATLDLDGTSQTIGTLAGGGPSGGLVTNSSAEPATLTLNGGDTTTYSGAVSNAGGALSLTKTGTGTFTFAGTDTATGPTTLDAGTLKVHGDIKDSAVTLDGGTLVGIGSVDGVTGGADTATFGADAPGQFTSTAAVAFGTGDTVIEYLVSPTSYNQIVNDSGITTLGGATLQLTAAPGFAPAIGDMFTVIDDAVDMGPVTGTFAGMPEGTVTAVPNGRMQISYKGGTSGDDVTLTDIGATATTALQTSNADPVQGTSVKLTATVSRASPNTDAPSGTVTFKDGSQTLGTEPLTGGIASLTTTQLPLGASDVTAVYSGDTVFVTSTSSPFAETVTAASTPRDVKAPTITGTAKAGSTLTCSPGTWTGTSAPTLTYQWSIGTTPLAGATGSTFDLPSIDEGTTLFCTVTATDAAGSAAAQSTGVKIPVPVVAHCPAATGTMTGTQIGQLKLGMTRTAARRVYKNHTTRGKTYQDFFCLTPMGVRAGYPSPLELKSLPKSQRFKFKNRVVWISTANPFYAFDGVRAGEALALAQKVLHTSAPIKVGKNLWYLARTSRYTIVLKVRQGVAQELGVASNALTKRRAAENVLMHSFS